jgi:hypothetical protein
MQPKGRAYTTSVGEGGPGGGGSPVEVISQIVTVII